jgi:hypothetical protein
MPIDADTKPNRTEVLQMIEEVEAEIDGQLLGTYTATDVYVDVPPTEGLSEDTLKWFEFITRHGYSPSTGKVVVPRLLPIISISKCYRRTTALSSSASWEELKEGFGENFIVLKEQTKDGQELGFALYFFQDAPTAGLQRLKMTYTYGWNINKAILRKYATLKTAIQVLKAKMGASEPAGLSQFVGGDLQTFVGSQYAQRIEILKAEIEEIEKKYFPEKTSIALRIV